MSKQEINEFELSTLELKLTIITENADKKSHNPVNYDKFHEHSWYEIFYAKDHVILLYLENQTKIIEVGNICIVAPNTVHFAEFTKQSECFTLTFSVENIKDTESAKKILSFLSFDSLKIFTPDDTCIKLLSILERQLNEYTGPLCSTLLLSFLLYCSGKVSKNTHDSNLGRIYRLESLLYQYSSESPSLKEIANELHLSSRQLSRIIKKQYGVSFREKIFSLKMQSAARQLNLGKSVMETAESVGYATSTAFTKAFKSHFGKTPSEYRKKFKETN